MEVRGVMRFFRGLSRQWGLAALSAGMVLSVVTLSKADITFPFVFNSGQVIRAADVNANFAAVNTTLSGYSRTLARVANMPQQSVPNSSGGANVAIGGRTLSFTKTSASTSLLINYVDLYQVTFINAGNFIVRCVVTNSSSGQSTTLDQVVFNDGTVHVEYHQLSRPYYFAGLPAGAYTAQIRVFAPINAPDISISSGYNNFMSAVEEAI